MPENTLSAARWMMTLSLAFHIIFAAVGIGLPLLLAIAEGLGLRTGKRHYYDLARKWAKAIGLLFAVGAVSGTALAFELGLLWPGYMRITGAVVGHVFALEGFAFFIEGIFIGLYLYAWDRTSPRAHWLCAVVIAFSGALSGWLVLGVNAWMQLPVGFEMTDARVTVTDPIAIFKRIGWFHMALHSTFACYLSVAFAVAGIYAWGWLKGRRDEYHRAALVIAMSVGGVAAVLQPVSGDFLAKFVFRTQPAKFAAMEGQFVTEAYAPLRIGGIPDRDAGETRYAIEIPGMLSFLAAHDFGQVVPGLNDVPRDLWPGVELTHGAFQVMVGLGVWMMLLSLWFFARWWRRRGALLDSAGLLRALVITAPAGFIALEAGWVVTEVGRVPWVIVGVMKISEAVTPARGVVPVFMGFSVLYAVLGVTVVVLLRSLASGHEPIAPQEPPRASDLPE